MKDNKKKMSLTQFFVIYIAILTLILICVSACTGSSSSNNTKVLESASPSAGTADPLGTDPDISPTDDNPIAVDPTADIPAPTPVPGESGATGVVTNPTSSGSLSGLKITIDPGHQAQAPEGKETMAPWSSETKAKNTSGTKGTATGTDEYLVNLQIGLKLRDALAAEGATVVMTRDNNDTSLSNQDRANISNSNNVDIIISIHCNGSDNTSVNGTEVYSRGSGDGSSEYAARSAAEAKLAEKLVNAVTASTGSRNRGAKLSDNYTGINYANAPCFILECGFLSNPDEDKKLCDSSYQDKIVTGIMNFLTENKDSL